MAKKLSKKEKEMVDLSKRLSNHINSKSPGCVTIGKGFGVLPPKKGK